MERSPCARRTLATGDFALVERCSCGAVHLTIGAVTLRLSPSAIAPLAETLATAASVIVLDQVRASLAAEDVLS